MRPSADAITRPSRLPAGISGNPSPATSSGPCPAAEPEPSPLALTPPSARAWPARPSPDRALLHPDRRGGTTNSRGNDLPTLGPTDAETADGRGNGRRTLGRSADAGTISGRGEDQRTRGRSADAGTISGRGDDQRTRGRSADAGTINGRWDDQRTRQ